jgi:glycosyltransferase involved in cell wall biosynthesis
MPKVSVIMPTYNQAHFIAEAIQSVLDQTFQDFEIVVVDDGSTDNTKEVVDSFRDPRIRYIHQENRGVAAASNTGLKASIGEYLAGLASDDLWLPRNLELKVKLLDSRPDIGLVCSDIYSFDSDTGATLGRKWQNRSDCYLRELQDGTRQPLGEFLSREPPFSWTTVMVRCHVFDDVGYFDESLWAEDYDMFVRVLQRFSSIGIINVPLVRYRVHRTSLSSNYEKGHLGMLAAINKIINTYSLSKENIRLIKRNKLTHTLFDYGWWKIITGETALGRKKLLDSIGANPWWAKPYLYLGLSLLGNRPIQTLESWKKRLERHKAGLLSSNCIDRALVSRKKGE